MVIEEATYVVMGLLNTDSIAYAIGRAVERLGGRVVYTVQDERFRRRFLDESPDLDAAARERLDLRYCDVTDEAQVAALFAGAGPVAGVAHSIAYANPRTCLGRELHAAPAADIAQSYQVSCVSFATVARHAAAVMPGGGSLVALTFESDRAFPGYNWMGVHKAALEALVRALARRHGPAGIRVNAVSAGPLWTKAASRIPDFGRLSAHWAATSPLPWDPVADKAAVADAVAFLLGPMGRRISGQVIRVDGGSSAMGAPLEDYERGTAAAAEGPDAG